MHAIECHSYILTIHASIAHVSLIFHVTLPPLLTCKLFSLNDGLTHDVQIVTVYISQLAVGRIK